MAGCSGEVIEGCGNHFILIDQTTHQLTADEIPLDAFSSSQVRRLCDPNFGIGADGVLWVRSVSSDDVDHQAKYEMVVYNADGSLAEMCGNGLRCVVQYLHHHHGLCTDSLNPSYIMTGAGSLSVSIDAHQRIGVRMGWPRPLIPQYLPKSHLPTELLSFYSLGNPHLVSFDLTHFSQRMSIASEWERSVEGGINISFAQLRSSHHVELHVYERGCGWTLGCGTGACATVYHGYREGLFQMDSSVSVKLPGGLLTIDISDHGLTMWGEAHEVYRGSYLLPY